MTIVVGFKIHPANNYSNVTKSNVSTGLKKSQFIVSTLCITLMASFEKILRSVKSRQNLIRVDIRSWLGRRRDFPENLLHCIRIQDV